MAGWPGVGCDGRRERPDDPLVLDGGLAAVLADGAPVDGNRTPADQALLHEFGDHGRDAASAIVVLPKIPRRLQVHEQRNPVAERLPIVERDFHAYVAGERRQIDWRIGGASDCRVDHDVVAKCLAGEDVGRLKVLGHHLDDPLASLVCALLAIAVGRGDGGRAWKRPAQRFGE